MKTFFQSLTCCLLALWSAQALSDVSAELDRYDIRHGETVTLTIRSDDSQSEAPDFSILEDVFDVLGTSRAQSTQIINGRVTIDNRWSVELMPRQPGEQVVPPIQVGSEFTQPLKLMVRKLDPAAKAQSDVFIETELEKAQVYVQEQNILTVRVFIATRLLEGQLSEPKADGLIVQKLGDDKNYQAVRGGRTYNVIERRYALFAEKSGAVNLPALVLSGRVADARRDPYRFFQSGRRIRIFGQPVTLDVLTIPQEFLGKPWLPAKDVRFEDKWTGLKEAKAGEPITREVSLIAVGLNDSQLPDLDFAEGSDMRIYTELGESATWTDGKNVITKKTWKLAIIPMRSGQLNVPPVRLEWFDTNSRKKAVAVLPGKTLAVADSAAGAVAAPPSPPDLPGDSEMAPARELSAVSADSGTPAAARPVTRPAGGQAEDRYWYWAALIFGVGWLLTIVALIAKGSKPMKKTVDSSRAGDDSINKRRADLARAINGADPAGVQKALIRWWNARWPEHKVTNTGQIIQLLAHPEARTLVTALERAIYAPGDDRPALEAAAWRKALKQGVFEPKKGGARLADDRLPPLYGR